MAVLCFTKRHLFVEEVTDAIVLIADFVKEIILGILGGVIVVTATIALVIYRCVMLCANNSNNNNNNNNNAFFHVLFVLIRAHSPIVFHGKCTKTETN